MELQPWFCERALATLRYGDTLFLDCGTTFDAIAAAQRRTLVVDPKYGLVRPARFAGLHDIDEVITEQ